MSKVLCIPCSGENDEDFLFCKYCSAPSCRNDSSRKERLFGPKVHIKIDEYAIQRRLKKFKDYNAFDDINSKRITMVMSLFEKFLCSRKPSASIYEATPNDVIEFLAWKDTAGWLWENCSS